jgi:hypothetical protein
MWWLTGDVVTHAYCINWLIVSTPDCRVVSQTMLVFAIFHKEEKFKHPRILKKIANLFSREFWKAGY